MPFLGHNHWLRSVDARVCEIPANTASILAALVSTEPFPPLLCAVERKSLGEGDPEEAR